MFIAVCPTGKSRVLLLSSFLLTISVFGLAGCAGLVASKNSANTTPTLPVISGVTTANITSTGVSIAWSTNVPTSSQVSYGTTAAYGSQSSLNSAMVTGHSVTLSVLTASTLYHFQVLSVDASNNPVSSADFTFTTTASNPLPTISGVAAGGITPTSATINWSTNVPTSSQVSYGSTAAYGSQSSLISTLNTTHSISLSGLSASTLYHFQAASVDASNNHVVSADFTFTTSASVTLPTISGVVPSGITSSGAIITWSTNTATSSRVNYGTTAAYGLQSTLNSSLVTIHSVALSGLAASTIYHFQVVSVDGSGNQVVSGDFTFTTSASVTLPTITGVASGNIASSSATITWTTNTATSSQVNYGTTSAYGQKSALISSLATAHSVTLSGLTASTLYHYQAVSVDGSGNQVASADFTFSTSAAVTLPIISAVASSAITSSGATITWTTNVATSSQVNYGTTTAYGSQSALNSSLVTSHSVTLSGLGASTLYHFQVVSVDGSGNQAVSADFAFTTAAAGTLPTISGVASSGITSSGVTVTWTTNTATNSQVNYGTTAAYGQKSALNSGLVTSHSVTLSGLAASTLYHYQVVSVDGSGNQVASADFTFTTSAAVTLPTISGVASSNITSSSATITWTTNTATSSQVNYGTTAAYGQKSALNSSLVTSHSASLSGLTASTLYHYQAVSVDGSGNQVASADFTFTTSAAVTLPTISGVASGNITSSGATITWFTNTATSSQVNYGITAAYGSQSALNSNLVTAHSVTLSGLTPSTLYHYQAVSVDGSGNQVASADFTFTTSAAVTLPTISGVASSNITSSGATITWTTNTATSSQVNYGTTAAYGSQSVLNSTLATSHSVTLSGLTASTLYHYQAVSVDGSGNQATSGDFTLTTSAASSGGSPALVQHVSHANTQSHSVNSYAVRFVFPTGGGNCVLVGVQSSGGSIPTVADDKGNSYTQVINGSDSTNTQITLFKAPVTNAGAQNLEVRFSGAASFVAAEASEFMNVDASCTLDGAASKGSGSGTALAAGSLNTAANGDLIWAFGIQDSSSTNIKSWTAGNNFALLGADVMDGHFTEWQIQNAAGSLNPSATLAPSNSWFMAAMAIKAGNSGTAPNGIHGVHNLHLAFPNGQSFPLTVQFPCTSSNGPIVVIGNAEPSNDFTGLSDSNGNHWTKRGAATMGNSSGYADIWDTDAATTACSPNMTVTINKTGVDTIGSTLIFIDVANCGAQPCFDSGVGYASATGAQTGNPGNVTGASITPSTSTGACFSSMAVDAHTITGVLPPALFLSSVATLTGSAEDPDFPDDENNGYAVIYNPGLAKFTLVWQETDILNNWANGITCYKGQ